VVFLIQGVFPSDHKGRERVFFGLAGRVKGFYWDGRSLWIFPREGQESAVAALLEREGIKRKRHT
jgi:hypothetical protein